MPMTHVPEVGAKSGKRKPVPVYGASDMQFGIPNFFWYLFLVTNRACSIFVPVYGVSFLVPCSGSVVRVFGADFQVCVSRTLQSANGPRMLKWMRADLSLFEELRSAASVGPTPRPATDR